MQSNWWSYQNPFHFRHIPQYIADKTTEKRRDRGRHKAIARATISGKTQPRNSIEGEKGINNTIEQILRAKNSAGKNWNVYGQSRVICASTRRRKKV